jgi:hypothetical protein
MNLISLQSVAGFKPHERHEKHYMQEVMEAPLLLTKRGKKGGQEKKKINLFLGVEMNLSLDNSSLTSRPMNSF